MINRFYLIALVFIPSSKKAISQSNSSAYAIHNASVIDVINEQTIENQTIIIEKSLIAKIIDSDNYRESDSIETLDFTGYFIVPGLIDAHVHLGTAPSADDNLETTKERLNYLLTNGVTTVRDMAGDARYLSFLSRQALLDIIPSPDIHYSALLAGQSFFKDPRTRAAAQGIPSGTAPWMRAIRADSDLDQVIAEAKGTGASGIKIYADLDGSSVQKIVRAAHAQKMKVWAHSCVFPARPSEVCQAQVDVISHATYIAWEEQEEIPSTASNRHKQHEQFNIKNSCYLRLIQTMNQNHTILDPTICVYKRYFPDSTLYQYGISFTKLAYENQVKIGVGTDLPLTDFSGVLPIIQEMSALQNDVGMKPIDILQAATIINAEMIGQEDEIGSIEVGKKANLLILKENPTEDINLLKNPYIVVKNGERFTKQ